MLNRITTLSTRIATRSAYHSSTKPSNFSNREERSPSRTRRSSRQDQNSFNSGSRIASTSNLNQENSNSSFSGRQVSYEEASEQSFGKFDPKSRPTENFRNSKESERSRNGVNSRRRERIDYQTEEGIPTEPTYPLDLSLSSLSPDLLQKMRLELMNRTGRIPDQEELERELPAWLKIKRRVEQEDLAKAQKRVNLVEWKEAKLDEAWVWKRAREDEAGLLARPQDLLEDVRVENRIKVREAEGFFIEKPNAKKRRELARRQPLPDESNLTEQEIQLSKIQRKISLKVNQKDLSKPSPYIETGPINPPAWLAHRNALKEDFPQGWAPPKRLSREAMELVRLLQRSDPGKYSTPILAARFKVSPEAIRRILKSNFILPPDEMERREVQRKLEKLRIRDLADDGGFRTSWAGDSVSERDEMGRLGEREEDRGISNQKRSKDVWPSSF